MEAEELRPIVQFDAQHGGNLGVFSQSMLFRRNLVRRPLSVSVGFQCSEPLCDMPYHIIEAMNTIPRRGYVRRRITLSGIVNDFDLYARELISVGIPSDNISSIRPHQVSYYMRCQHLTGVVIGADTVALAHDRVSAVYASTLSRMAAFEARENRKPFVVVCTKDKFLPVSVDHVPFIADVPEGCEEEIKTYYDGIPASCVSFIATEEGTMDLLNDVTADTQSKDIMQLLDLLHDTEQAGQL